MKILWFTNTPCGATEKLTGNQITGGGWLYALSEQLVIKHDIELHIAFYWGEKMDSFNYNGIYYHPILLEGEGGKWGRLVNRYISSHSDKLDKKSLPRLIEVVKEVSPDVIHIHGSESNFGMIAAEQLPCPVVLSVQGMLSLITNMYYRGFTKQEISKNEGIRPKILMSGISLKEKSIRRRGEMERAFFKNIPNIIGRTFWDKAGSLALNPQRRYYEVGEIMRHEFYEQQWIKDAYSNPFVICSTISSGYFKGLETVYQTAQILKNVGFQFVWNIIGSQNGDTLVRLSEKKVGEKAENLGIHLVGTKNATEMVEMMTQADLFVQVSHIENSPNSLCEAMLLGMPIIATFAGGTASLLENDVEGRLIQDGEPYSMAGMIMEMAADFNNAQQMGKNAKETAQKRHDPEYVCGQLLNAYHEILDNCEV